MAELNTHSVKGCGSCRAWVRRDSSFGEFFGLLDRGLYGLAKRLKAGLDGGLVLLALRGLESEVLGWVAAASVEFDYEADYSETLKILGDLIKRLKRGPGLKPPEPRAPLLWQGPGQSRRRDSLRRHERTRPRRRRSQSPSARGLG